MRLIPISFVAVALLAGCATTGSPAARDRVAMRDHSGAPTTAMRRAYFDSDAGTCTAGSTQLLTQAEFKALVDAWKEVADDDACVGPDKAGVPSRGAYPEVFRVRGIPGAAHVLVRLERDGSVESVHAVCATNEGFAEAATATARTIEYTPMTCDGVPRRSAFLLPFAYDI